jgi:poly-D-alanine transfer protein DltD
MKKPYLSIQEASLVSHKHANTIRELLKSNKVQYTQNNRKYLIHKESLALFYKDNAEEILAFGEEKINRNVSVTNESSTTMVTEQLKPLVESLTYHIKKYDDVQKLLTDANEEKIELEKNYYEKIQLQKSGFLEEKNKLTKDHKNILFKKEIALKILLTVVI